MAIDLSNLHKLESLRCSVMRSISSPNGFGCRFRVIFPCEIILGAWRTLCALHKLEVLMIRFCSFQREEETCDEEWELTDGDVFLSLQFLHLQRLSIVNWRADETNFPRLSQLRLFHCWNLEEIPTLQLIDLQECSESANASVKRIVEEQSENGNDDLELCIRKSAMPT